MTMNWMIDGANGDLYRQAMGYPQLKAATDEWEIERTLHLRNAKPRKPLLAPAKAWTLALAAKLRSALAQTDTRPARPVTPWTFL
jgi:hypothetical protein